MSVLGTLVLLDELSWGQRLLGFEPVLYDNAKKLDSAHDAVGVLRRFSGSRAAFRVVWFGAAAAGLVGLWLARGTGPFRWVRARARHTPLFFGLLFVFLAWWIMSIDEYAIPKFKHAPAVEEMLEFSAILTLAAAAAALFHPPPRA